MGEFAVCERFTGEKTDCVFVDEWFRVNGGEGCVQLLRKFCHSEIEMSALTQIEMSAPVKLLGYEKILRFVNPRAAF